MHRHASLFNNLSMINTIFFAYSVHIYCLCRFPFCGGCSTFLREVKSPVLTQHLYKKSLEIFADAREEQGRTPRKKETDWNPTRVLHANLDDCANANLFNTSVVFAAMSQIKNL